ncbi:MAG: cytochrome P450 [Propionibacterium sp.]|nr:cytochrome P450 [Propionibacterium sp.]
MDQRRAVRDEDGPPIERSGSVWRIRSLAAARQVLQARHATTQAGFTSEYVPKGYTKHHPILFSDGALHDEQRRKVARFFAPRVVSERYRDLMHASADRLLAQSPTTIRLDDLALRYAVEVTREVVGMTESDVGAMSRRLEKFFNQPPFDITKPGLGRTKRQWAMAAVNGLSPIARYWFADVRPAVRARRKQPREDVVSHLIAEGYSNLDILVECVTYGTAGMVTTREFIAMACWHLLGDDALRERYLAAEERERLAILTEIIRLEPVVGHLYRRVQEPIEVDDGDVTHTIPAGDLVDVHVRHTNMDTDAMGEEPTRLCPHREVARGVDRAGLSFGDGAHKCPGQPLAILETDVLLSKLLARSPRIVTPPTLGWDELVAGYSLRGFDISLGG